MRPRKQRKLKVIEGTLRPDRDFAARPPPAGEPLRKPVHLKGRAAAIFKDYAEQCPWLTRPDSRALALFCELLAEPEKGAAEMQSAKLAQLRGLAGDLGFTQRCKLAARQHFEAEDEPERPKAAASKYFDRPASEFFD